MKVLKRAELEEVAEGCYRFKKFSKHAVTAAFSGRRFRMNFSPGGNASLAIAHRKHFCQSLGLAFGNLVYLDQVHGTNIARVGAREAGKGIRSLEDSLRGTDAVLTNVTHVTLSVHTADCAPLFFFDPKKRGIGMAHVGWRGAEKRLASKMVQAFRIQFLSQPEHLMISIGPMIRSCCYQVGPEFQEAFGGFVEKRPGGFYFDLFGWICDDLKSQGISQVQIQDSGICTVCDNKRFPSYRKEGEKVRHMLSVLALNE